jgi:putative two-component system response regulator
MSGELILVVEDEPALASGLRDTLEMVGYQVMTAGHGQEGLRLLEQIEPALIISDISMPIMDGYQFFSAVRAQPRWTATPFLFLTARSHKSDMLIGKGLGADDYLTKPWSTDELLVAIAAKLKRSQEIAIAQLQQAYKVSLSVLANAIEARDAYTRGHVERVAQYALAMGRELRLSAEQLNSLELGAILHDIGKIAVPEAILAKPASLTSRETEEMRKHPITGAHMLKDMTYLAEAIPAVRHHHEHYDGTGYPDGLSGEDIPLEARIVAVADALDAMTSERAYRIAQSFEQAAAEIVHQSGQQFDPQVVAAFRRIWEAGQLLLPTGI